jgi:hypothetical protein
MVNEPLALEFKNGKVYAGCLDRYYDDSEGVIDLYNCVLLDKTTNRWVDHDILINRNGKPELDHMPSFLIESVKNIFILPEAYAGLFLDDFLKIFLNPYYRPLIGFKCKRNSDGKHEPNCDAKLHDALDIIADEFYPFKHEERTENDDRKMWEAFGYIRNRLLLSGAKIP